MTFNPKKETVLEQLFVISFINYSCTGVIIKAFKKFIERNPMFYRGGDLTSADISNRV